MPKSILVYFKSENDAESARAELQSLRVSDLYVDHLPEGDDKHTYLPIDVGYSPEAMESGMIKPKGVLTGLFGKKKDPVTHLIQAKVQEEDYAEAMEVLKRGNGFVQK